MGIVLTKKEALEELIYLKETWKKPPFTYPAFCVELDYVDFFIFMLKSFRTAETNNIVPFVSSHFEQGFDAAFLKICRILDQHSADGSDIYSLMSERKFIIRKDKRNYNRKVPGKCPKGLKNDEWEGYNNWLATTIMWNGFIEAHDPDYSVYISQEEDIETSIKDLLNPDYKPLWGMKQSYYAAGRPCIGWTPDCVTLRPLSSWIMYMKQLKTQ